MRKLSRRAALATVMLIGASNGVATFAGASQPPGECTDEQIIPEFTMGVLRPPQSLDPSFAISSGAEGGNELAALFDALMQYNVETGEVVPRLAESLEPNADFTEWTLTLPEGITFGSGAPLNTEAVRFSVDLHRAEGSTSLNFAATQVIEEMVIESDTVMVFKLSDAWAGFPILLGPTAGIPVDPAVYEELGPEAFAADPQGGGAGPFQLESWVRGEEFVVTAKDDYWGVPPCVERIRFVSIADDQTRVDAFVNGEIDAMYVRGPAAHNYIEEQGIDSPSLSQVVNGGSVLFINNGARGVERPGGDVRVRRAIALAIDPTVISERVFAGGGEPSKALLSETSALYTEGITELPYDPDEARRLLDEVKAETGYDGALYYPVANETNAMNTALTVEAMLEAVGFVVELDSSFDQTAISRHLVETADFDIMSVALSMWDAELWGQLSRRIDYGTPSGWIGFDIEEHPEWEEAMTALKLAGTVEEQQAAMVRLSEIWNDVVPSVVLDHHQVSVYWSDEFEGLDFTKDGIVLFGGLRAAG